MASSTPLLNSFLIKIASRCNLDCDYCYMYQHLDQSWKQQPAIMAKGILNQLGKRLADYVQETGLKQLVIIFHGGEPLLATSKKLIEASTIIRQEIPISVKVEFTMQTNGVLLTAADAEDLERNNIHVSISLDGPANVNDLHRLDHKGRSSFQKTLDAVFLMKQHPAIFAGIIAVIDAGTNPAELLKFFNELDPPSLDFLLPDANYLTPPPGRLEEPDRYISWLIHCFDEWFDNYPHIKIRTFESILNGLLGLPSETDAFGFGDVSLLSVETNGSYHDLDVLKITGEGTDLGIGDVFTKSIQEAAQSPALQKHRQLLTREGLCDQCQACQWVELCGGGAVPHRFGSNSFDNPTIYCNEFFQLIEHAQKRVDEQLSNELHSLDVPMVSLSDTDLKTYEGEELDNVVLEGVRQQWMQNQLILFDKVLQIINIEGKRNDRQIASQLLSLAESQRSELAIQPSVVTWCDVLYKQSNGIAVHSIDGKLLAAEFSYVHFLPRLIKTIAEFKIHRQDSWLRRPFGEKILFEAALSEVEVSLVHEAFQLIELWNPAMLGEIKKLSPELQFMRDPTAHPDKIVSFSDNSVPGSLYIQLRKGDGLISAYDLADSIIHEHRHQKLYLLQRVSPIVTQDFPLVPSPWREELRPPSGLFHALFVFVKLHNFWRYLATQGSVAIRDRAEIECSMVEQKINDGLETVRNCPLTETGQHLLAILEETYMINSCF